MCNTVFDDPLLRQGRKKLHKSRICSNFYRCFPSSCLKDCEGLNPITVSGVLPFGSGFHNKASLSLIMDPQPLVCSVSHSVFLSRVFSRNKFAGLGRDVKPKGWIPSTSLAGGSKLTLLICLPFALFSAAALALAR